jgi:hypothetical protein
MPQGLSEWIGKNLWAILALIGAAVASYNLGTVTMATMKADLDNLKARQRADEAFHFCLIRTLEQLDSGKEAPCKLEQPN